MKNDIEDRGREHTRLALKFKSGDEDAAWELYEELKYFVKGLVTASNRHGIIKENDIDRIGWEAVRSAAKNFDPEISPNFMSYFKMHVRNHINKEIRSNVLTIKVPYEAYT